MTRTSTSVTGYSKVMNALKGNPNQTVPFGLLLSLYGKNYVKESIEEYYTNPNVFFKGQTKIVEKFNPDIISTPFVLCYDGLSFGSEIKYFRNSPPQLKKPIAKDYRDLPNIQVPKKFHASKEYIFDTAQLISSQYKNNKIIAGLALSNTDIPAMIMGIEGWLDTLLFHKKEAKELLLKTTDYFVSSANEMFTRGIDVLVIPVMFSNPSIITTSIMNEITFDFLQNGLKQIKGPVIIHHGGAQIERFLHFYNDLPNVIGFAIDSSEDFNTARKSVGNKLILGNLDIKILANKKPEIIRKRTLDILNNMENDNNFIFYNSNADIPLETSEEQILAATETIKKFKIAAT